MKPSLFEDLTKRLDPSLIARRKVGGRSQPAPYIEGFEAINQANRHFGFDGWSSDVIAVDAQTTRRVDGTTGEATESVLYYRATVRVTIKEWGISKTDIGVGVLAAQNGDAHDMAVKGAVTDGLKRALRQFGPQFGNDLYDKDPAQVEESRPEGREPQPVRTPPPARSNPAAAAAQQQARNTGQGTKAASEAQVRMMFATGERVLHWSEEAVLETCQRRYGGRDPKELQVREASEFIEWMKGGAA